ncbi:MAG: DUF4886 domain-containing protein [Clostridia bacterium]|nr:DUF4886 domain-containing protein [Clostridia bacterium]
MKLLSIGNSFSTDAHRFLNSLAEQNGICLGCYNLFIGGCSLETHWKNFIEKNAYYDLEVNGNEATEKISINEALSMENWDVVTVQQASAFSGIFESYVPYITDLVEAVRDASPVAKLFFHETWSYETGSLHEGFLNYNSNQKKMYLCIKSATQKAAELIKAEIIPTGDVVQYVRENIPEFNYENGGISLCRDSFHLSEDYGRFLASAVWLKAITGKNLKEQPFLDFEYEMIEKLIKTVNKIV